MDAVVILIAIAMLYILVIVNLTLVIALELIADAMITNVIVIGHVEINVE